MSQKPYTLIEPAEMSGSLVFASPHSGRNYPMDFLDQSILDERSIRSSEDAFVDLLFGAAPRLGAPLIAAHAPRAYVDLNRASDELDPALVKGLRNAAFNARVASGLGVIPRVVSGGRAIYRGKLTLGEAQRRLSTHWHPYHRALQRLLEQRRRLFSEAVLIDCHSMPHEAVAGLATSTKPAPQIVLGDRFGAAADGSITKAVEAAFQRAGFTTARNTPFAGAYIAQHYGRPARQQHVIQVEVDRSLYMDEEAVRPHGGFDEVKERLSQVVAEIIAFGREARPVAAE